MDKNELLKILTPSLFDAVKILLTAVIILIVTKLQLVSDKLSALLIALPLTSIPHHADVLNHPVDAQEGAWILLYPFD